MVSVSETQQIMWPGVFVQAQTILLTVAFSLILIYIMAVYKNDNIIIFKVP